ncbi:MAG: Ig-like domain-containing protein [Ferruginibacter sp.]
MRSTHILFTLFIVSFLYLLATGNAGCAQIGMPTGGAKDTIPPRLVSASPKLKSTNVTGNKITLTFNEYVELREAQTNVLISPFPKKQPSIDFKLKTVTVKLKDTLLPNTTYSINFGNAIVDNNEGNPFSDFTYVFSTGNQIDSFTLGGKVLIAETGRFDSTIIAMLYRNTDDSAVQKRKPDYVAKLKGDGSFMFFNLPAGKFKVYALGDGDGGKTYNSRKEMFAFEDAPVTVSENTEPVVLYASALEKESLKATAAKSPVKNKKLVYVLPAGMQGQDLLTPFELTFANPLKKFEPAKLILRDSNYKPVPAAVWSIDSSRTKIILTNKWQAGMAYRLIMDTTALSDSADNRIAKADTLRFLAKELEDYGNVVLRFSNLDLAKHPVLQFVQGDQIKNSYRLTTLEWSDKFINPGEYDIRILFDSNNNGRWDPGDYSKKLQPERAITLKEKLGVRANWDNERDIKL